MNLTSPSLNLNELKLTLKLCKDEWNCRFKWSLSVGSSLQVISFTPFLTLIWVVMHSLQAKINKQLQFLLYLQHYIALCCYLHTHSYTAYVLMSVLENSHRLWGYSQGVRVKHSLVGQCSSKVLLDVCVHHWAEVVVFTVPEQVYNENLEEEETEGDVKIIIKIFHKLVIKCEIILKILSWKNPFFYFCINKVKLEEKNRFCCSQANRVFISNMWYLNETETDSVSYLVLNWL